MRSLPRLCLPICIVGALLLAAPVRATWSIIAVDPETREVGAAGASCIAGSEMVARLVPGRGVVATQGIPSFTGRNELARLLARGESPAAALAMMRSSGSDAVLGVPTTAIRQYGVVALGFESAPVSATGAWTVGWAGARIGRGVSVQGNMLAGPEVVEKALRAFEEQRKGCTRRLSDRLMDALEAGARAGGDRRCSPELAALSAFVMVARPEDDAERPSLRLGQNRPGASLISPWRDLQRGLLLAQERGTAEENPVLLLRKAYEEEHGSPPGCR